MWFPLPPSGYVEMFSAFMDNTKKLGFCADTCGSPAIPTKSLGKRERGASVVVEDGGRTPTRRLVAPHYVLFNQQ